MRVDVVLRVLLCLAPLASSCSNLAIESVTPSELVAGGGGEVTATGAGFTAETQFLLEGEGGVEVSLATSAVAETSATLLVPAAAPAGLYDVVARAGSGEGRLDSALTLSDEVLRVTFLDVGQGDATIIVAPDGTTMLIDGGNRDAVDEVERGLERLAEGQLDIVVVSHHDADHLGGVVQLLSGSDRVAGTDDDLLPDRLIVPDDTGECSSNVCEDYRALLAYPARETPDPGEHIDLGGVDIEVVSVNGVVVGHEESPPGIDENARSVVVLASFADRTVAVLGDLTGGGINTVDLETDLAERRGPVDVLRVAHHGSQTSSPATAVARWQPALAVVSVGTDNTYCHPDPAVLGRLAAQSGAVMATGSGIVDDGDRCDDGATVVPDGAALGVGDIDLEIAADGALRVNGEQL